MLLCDYDPEQYLDAKAAAEAIDAAQLGSPAERRDTDRVYGIDYRERFDLDREARVQRDLTDAEHNDYVQPPLGWIATSHGLQRQRIVRDRCGCQWAIPSRERINICAEHAQPHQATKDAS